MGASNGSATPKAKPSRVLVAVIALLAGIICTTGYFLAGPGRQQADAPTESAPASQPESGSEAEPEPEYASPQDTRAILASWDPESPAYQQLTSFVEAACDPDSDGYIPPEDRVATFDMDGTFISERAPIYIDQTFICWHVLHDPEYDAPEELVAQVESVMDQVEAGTVPEDVRLGDILAQSYLGRTPAELEADVVRFASTTDVMGFTGMTYAESFYRPMVEVIEYLRANGFDVYVVTACERYVSRALAVEYVGFEPSHIIGSDLLVEASGQEGEEGLEYTFEQDDELVIAGEEILETGKTNKVVAIENEIGRRPVLAFGNSTGDFAMLNYVTANPDHPGLAFLVVADDTVREYGDEEKAAKMRQECADEGWVAISMRDDWTTIYGEGVERTSLREAEELEAAA